MARVELAEVFDGCRHNFLFAGQFVSEREHHKGWMIAKGFQKSFAFLAAEVVVVWFAKVGPVW
jgi:hypothetical protein